MSTNIISIQGQPLKISVVACNKLKNTEWITKQDPYVCIDYGSTKFRTRTCTDGGKSPTFQDKFVFHLIEGLREVDVFVWNSNTITRDDFIGSGKVQLQKVLSEGFDDTLWPLQTNSGRYAGEVRLIMHYANANKPATPMYSAPQPSVLAPYPGPPTYPPSATPMYSAPQPSVLAPYPGPPTYPPSATPMYSASQPSVLAPYPGPPTYPPSATPMYSAPPPSAPPYSGPSTYPPTPYPSHPSNYHAAYPPAWYNEPQIGAYPPTPYRASTVYPPPPYPPVAQQPAGYPHGPYPGMYHPRPY